MHNEDIAYELDGVQLIGHLAVDRDRPAGRPGVLVCHEGSGLSDHTRGVADRLATLGYVAFALDYHGGGRPLPAEEMRARLGPLLADPLGTRRLARAGLDVLLGQPEVDPTRLAAIGYCFGGTMALELARGGAEVQAVVGFHSGLATTRPADAAGILGRVLVCIGADDPIIPPDQRAAFEDEMRAAGVDWQMHLYGGAVHSFTNPLADGSMPAIKYDRRADSRSWQAMLALFAEVF